MMTFFEHQWREILIALGALIFVILVPASDLLNLGEQTGAGRITLANRAYLTDAANEGLKETLLLGEVAALLEVLSSTDIGIELIVSGDVQAGGSAMIHKNRARHAPFDPLSHPDFLK
jgi:hypothetical protein